MNDVNLNRPDLKLVTPSAQASDRAQVSSEIEGRIASTQSSVQSVKQTAVSQPSVRAQDSSKGAETGVGRKISGEQLGDAVSRLNEFVQSVKRDLQFEVDNELGQAIVKVVDQETQEVIRQIPDEVALRLAEKLLVDEPLTLFNITV